MIQRLAFACMLASCIGCAAAPERHSAEIAGRSTASQVGGTSYAPPRSRRSSQDSTLPFEQHVVGLPWEKGQALAQGFFGVSEFSKVEVEGGVDGDEGDLDQLPLIGGGGQWKIGGDRVSMGLEGLVSFAWRGNAEAFAVSGGGGVVVVDVDVMTFELFGGPFASMFVGDKLRLYGGAGPLLQWVEYDQEGFGLDADGSGFGSGWYARTGMELVLSPEMLIGLGVRWSDTNVDLDGNLGDLDMEGLQFVLTVSRLTP